MDRSVPQAAAVTIDEAMRLTPREAHLPADQQGYARVDRALPIGHGQTNSQPSTVRAMLVALDVREGDRVLDVGSGSGWTTVLLARLVGPSGEVTGVERVPDLTSAGRRAVEAADLPWARVRQATEGVLGAPDLAPFDRILVSAQGSEVPPVLVDQLGHGGVMVLPVSGRLLRVGREDRPEVLGAYVFVPLVTGSARPPGPGIGR